MPQLPRNLDLNLLPVFDALMRRQSVTLAAQDVGLTQASASNALTRLRRALGDRLLERQGNRMVPTRLALALWPAVAGALGQIAGGIEAVRAFDPATATDRFRIGMDDYAVSTLAADLAAQLAALAPGTQLEILPATHPADDDRLRRGEIDLFCGAVWQGAPGLGQSVLWGEQFTGLAAPRLALGPAPSLDAVLALPHVLVSVRGAVRGNLDVGLASLGRARRVGATVPSYDTAARLAAEAGHLFFCGTRLARRFQALYGLSAFDPPLAVPGFQIRMLWNRRDDGSPAQGWLRGQIAALAG